MKLLTKDTIKQLHGFNFHLQAGYPAPKKGELEKAWNTKANGNIKVFTHRRSVRNYLGTDLEMKYSWGRERWEADHFFFAQKAKAAH